MKATFSDYLREAFNARPFGMLIPPNWIGLGTFGVLGFLNPGFWLLGVGLEMGYLLGLSHLPRFRAIVDGRMLSATQERTEQETAAVLRQLDEKRRYKFETLRKKCRQILDEQKMDSAVRQIQAGGLGRLLGIYLQLLVTQAAMERLLGDKDADVDSVANKLAELQGALAENGLADDLRKSIGAQLEILQKRHKTLSEGGQRLEFTESELERIEQQVALIRDEVRLSAAPDAIGTQIDRVSEELSETSQWVSDQQRLFGEEGLANQSFGVVLDSSQESQ